jgi:exodeoxyribonuclease VII small subunit
MMARRPEKAEQATGSVPEPYDRLVERLETVVAELEAGGLPLEQSIEKFAEGMRLVREAGQRLDEAERRVDQLVKTASGEAAEAPFGPGGGQGDGGR